MKEKNKATTSIFSLSFLFVSEFQMASRFDDSSSGSSEDEEEAPQLDGMTSSDDDEAFEGPFGDGDDDADVLEVRG